MGLFGKKKKEQAEQAKTMQAEKKQAQAGQNEGTQAEGNRAKEKAYIRGAGGTIVTKSLLAGTSKLKWIFRQEEGQGNGWIAFGDTDTQEYVNDVKNMEIVDFNTLIDIEPAVANIFFMPIGSDLEFRSDKTGKYFVDTRTGKEIREAVKHPAQVAFEKNLKFLNQDIYPPEFFDALFTKGGKMDVFRAGNVDFPTGEVVLADPLAYLGTRYETVLEKRIPAGSYPVELSLCRSEIAGLRIAAARLVINDVPAVRYEIAMPKGKQREDLGKAGVFTFFGVDTGLACFADAQVSEEYRVFFENWQKENPGKNKYTDYFKTFFEKSYEAHPETQNPGGSFLEWSLPETGRGMVLFTSGMGDGIYSGYWGLDAEGEGVSLTAVFMNPEYF